MARRMTARGLVNNKLRSERAEVKDYYFYDSVLTTVSIAQTLRLFQNTVGTTNIIRTNMKTAGAMPGGHDFLVTAMRLYMKNMAGTPFFFAGGAGPTIHPVNVLFGSLTWSFYIDPIIQYEGDGAQFWEQVDYVNDTAAVLAMDSNIEKGFKILRFNNPLVIPANRSFWIDVTLTAPAAAQGYTAAGTPLYGCMYGFLRRKK